MSTQKRRWRGPVALVVAIGAAAAALAGSPAAFESIAGPYESGRLALLSDDLAGARRSGEEIRRRLGAVAVSEETAGAALLREIERAAGNLAGVATIEAAREAFAELSRPMVLLRQATGDDSVVVAYCPMARKSWLQPEGELGNPYFGPGMAKCGEIVPEPEAG